MAFPRALEKIAAGRLLPVVLAMSCMIHEAAATPTASLVASRLTGPAPLAVFFDATSTVHTNSELDTYRELAYRFSFGDPSSGVWAVSGRSRNEQTGGPIAAHVFDTPGTYVVSVTARDAAGLSSTASVTITVTAPDAAFPGDRTVCISRTTDFTGCPANASRIANATSWPAFRASSRYMLRAGQDFSSLGVVNLREASGVGLVDVQLVAFGSGTKPRTSRIVVDSGNTGPSSWPRRVSIVGLDALDILNSRGAFDLLLYRNDITRGGMIDIASAFDFALTNSPATSWANPDGIYIVENRIDRNFDTAVSANPSAITGNAVRFVILGNDIDRTAQHNVRIWQAHKAFIAHNSISGRAGDMIRATIKLHSAGLAPVQSSLPVGVTQLQRSSQIVIADNHLGSPSSNVQWLAATAPQNNQSAEGLEDVIWEDNEFRHGPNYMRDITWAGRRMTERGNRNVTDGRAAEVGIAGELGLPADWNGPYFSGVPSMKARFQIAGVPSPRAPILTVE
jgi:PKD repeat protein